MNISEALAAAADILRDSGVATPRREAASLLTFILQCEGTFLIAHPEYRLSPADVDRYRAIVERRSRREPYQYLVGKQEFYRLEMEVTPDVLIPRPETEILVEEAIKLIEPLDHPRVCEVGTGSGCISVAILYEVQRATGVATDISPAALAVAARNAERHGVADRLQLVEGDVFAGVEGPFDLIVSNPPYVPNEQIERLQAEVRDHEPFAALSGGDDGLDIISRLVSEAPERLHPGCFMLMEIGFDQTNRVRALFDRTLWEPPSFLPDLQGIPRIVKSRRR